MGYTVSFTVGTKLYIGLGEGAFGASMGTWLQEFWQYDAVSGVWTRKANYPGMTAGYGIGFSVGGYGYVFNNPDSNGAPGLWQYDTATDSWVVKASLPLGPEQGMVAFGVNGYGYVGLGTLDADFNNTIWQYDPTTNTWSQKNNFPGRATSFTASFVVGNYAYVGTGEVGLNTDSATTAFYQYNPATDTWTQKGNFPGGARNSATGFSIGNMGYLGTGLDINGHYLSDFWQYNAASDSWARKSDFGGGGRFAAAGFSGANLGYMGFGQGFDQISPNEATNVFFDLWQYQP
jgi:N-acetylneuraminic acid mutarotase